MDLDNKDRQYCIAFYHGFKYAVHFVALCIKICQAYCTLRCQEIAVAGVVKTIVLAEVTNLQRLYCMGVSPDKHVLSAIHTLSDADLCMFCAVGARLARNVCSLVHHQALQKCMLLNQL